MNKLVVDLLQQKGLGCCKVLKKRWKQKGKISTKVLHFPMVTMGGDLHFPSSCHELMVVVITLLTWISSLPFILSSR